MFTIKGSMNPTVVNTISGTYAVSGSNWISVPEGTTLKDLNWIDTSPKIKIICIIALTGVRSNSLLHYLGVNR